MASLRLELRPGTEEAWADVPMKQIYRLMLFTSRDADKELMESRWQEIEVGPSLEGQLQVIGW